MIKLPCCVSIVVFGIRSAHKWRIISISEVYKRKPNWYLIDISQSESKSVMFAIRNSRFVWMRRFIYPTHYFLLCFIWFVSIASQASSFFFQTYWSTRLCCRFPIQCFASSVVLLTKIPNNRPWKWQSCWKIFLPPFSLTRFGSHSFVAHIERNTLIVFYLAWGTESTDFWFAPAPMPS